MKISYNKLWKLLIDKGITKTKLCEMTNLSAATMAKLGKGKNVNTEVLLRICEQLNCNITDIMEIEEK